VAQLVLDPTTNQFDRRVWDEPGPYTPVVFKGRTYWLIWSDALGWTVDPRYRHAGALYHVDLHRTPPELVGKNRPHEYHCTLVALRSK
jgi:hypothetical protein